MEDDGLRSDSGPGAGNLHQEVSGGGKVTECQPGAAGGDVLHHRHQLGVPDLKQILELALHTAATAVHGEGGESLVVRLTLELQRLLV